MKGYLSRGLAISMVAPAAYAQATRAVASLSAAAATVTTSPSAAPPLFPWEKVQLTENALARVDTALNNQSLSRIFAFGAGDSANNSGTPQHSCKVMPGDATWPTESTWNIFDQLLGGGLLKPAPLAASCYPDWPEYNTEQCSEITSNWLDDSLHSIMAPLDEGRSCMPVGYNYTSTCTQGGYPTYVVNVSTVAQIQLSVNFARNQNLRLIVKNTGHDFNGKPSGKGGLSIWTHRLKDKVFYPSFTADGGYVGPAIKLGAGVQVSEAYDFGKELNLTVIGGGCLSVGVAGGFTLGGGHSPLSSMYGMAADQVLALEVVLADGRFITATSKQNSDVFWMLLGGGGSTIGVVTSMTVKAYPQLPTTLVTFNWTMNDTPNAEAFWAAFQSYLDNFEDFVNAGTYGYYFLGSSGAEKGEASSGETDYNFRMVSFVAPNMTVPETQNLLKPWFDTLNSLNVSFTPIYSHADNFYEVWEEDNFPLETGGLDIYKLASRLLPRNVFENQDLRNRNFLAQKDAVDKGLFIMGFHISGKGSAVEPPTNIAVLPAWRDALSHVIVATEWDFTSSWETVYNSSLFVTDWMDALREISPDSGAYMNEGDLLEPNFQQAFYGANYPRLYELKQKYDPTGLFFALTAVGSEDWEVQVTDPLPYSWNNNGRLCPRSS
ncbi:restculine oxidase precursor [Aspergillus niger]|uniref:Contig An01c0030, genomic contig n=2 Tax=Aspergillus niger TaxID=5061 RepID=A2Q7F3_ASPNC|nr:uncharacterized protein An01g00490 [Aspergillus niger]GJP94419.1 restculine oxidase precursor [Aspergillus niger]CAK43437.1 unnamed protein product [Aspergillus niger]